MPVEKVHLIACGTYIWMHANELQQGSGAPFLDADNEGVRELSGRFQTLLSEKAIFWRYVRSVSSMQRHHAQRRVADEKVVIRAQRVPTPLETNEFIRISRRWRSSFVINTEKKTECGVFCFCFYFVACALEMTQS